MDVGKVLILEDDATRVRRFQAVLEKVVPGVEAVVWRSARVMVREVEAYLDRAVLISLDHDLYPAAGETEDPGDGLEVAKFLAARRPGVSGGDSFEQCGSGAEDGGGV